MGVDRYLSILRNLCEFDRQEGIINEEIIERLVDAGANLEILIDIGFTDRDIDDYLYYMEHLMGESRSEVYEVLL